MILRTSGHCSRMCSQSFSNGSVYSFGWSAMVWIGTNVRLISSRSWSMNFGYFDLIW